MTRVDPVSAMRLAEEIAKRQEVLIYTRYQNNIEYYRELQRQADEMSVSDEVQSQISGVDDYLATTAKLYELSGNCKENKTHTNTNYDSNTQDKIARSPMPNVNCIDGGCAIDKPHSDSESTFTPSTYVSCPFPLQDPRFKVIDVFLNEN
ncbi:uncharacterized protein CGFF_00436 [Nakaseomyces glabratus]|nr:hypothetical protein J6894_02380 [Nakaseomyces glabratus]QNG14461.1 uncharacterized protein GWK60_H07315 [Nakaseomyces glabratus]SCV12879.1 uncharacterized protein CGFF_00436 [Nakaseomyces glabratus]SLM10632.1 uncharacterized protein CGFF_00436 [Nakaseomyces glabratus]